MVDKAIAEETKPGPETPKEASMSEAKAYRRRSSGFRFGKEAYDGKQALASGRQWRREWELESELHRVKLQNSTFQEQIRILLLERDAAEAELHETKGISTCLRKDFEVSEELLDNTQSAVRNLQRRKVEVEVDLEQKDKEIQYTLAERDSMAAELAEVTDEKNTLECEVQELQLENREYESWMDEITVCVQDTMTHHGNLESKLQVSEDIIHQLQKVIKTDAATSEMDKKALLRTNTNLKGQIQTLKTTLEAEQKKKSETETNVDWKKECLKVHEQKSQEMEQMQARLREKTAENASLKLQSNAHLRALEALEVEKAASAAFDPMYSIMFEDIHGSSAEENIIS